MSRRWAPCRQHAGGWIWALAIAVSLALHVALLWRASVQRPSADDGAATRQGGTVRLSFRVMPRAHSTLAAAPKPRRSKPRPVPRPQPRTETAPVPAQPQPKQRPAAATARASAGDPRLAERARRAYLGVLLAQIEEHKFYPRAARRRGLQGVIQVSFLLHQDGAISGLQVAQGPDVLRRAATDAVNAALPLPSPPSQVRCPLQVSYGMAFRLR